MAVMDYGVKRRSLDLHGQMLATERISARLHRRVVGGKRFAKPRRIYAALAPQFFQGVRAVEHGMASEVLHQLVPAPVGQPRRRRV